MKENYNSNSNSDSNDSQNNLSKKNIHFRKTLLSKIYFIMFSTSIVLLVAITIINIIFIFYEILLPRIFFPGLIIYIATFICAGAGVGSYGPVNRSEPQLMYMRKCTSIVMLIICLIIFPIFLYQNFNLYSSINEAKNFCIENNGKSKGDIYSALFEEKERIFALRKNLHYKHKNGLTCLESQKCLKSISNSQIFVCNYNHQEKYNNSRCNKVFETDQVMNTFDNANMAYFVASCMDLKKDKIRPNIEIYRCFSSKNLCKDDSITKEEENEIEINHKKNIKKNDEQIFDIDRKLYNVGYEMYSYDMNCSSNIIFNLLLIVVILFILANCFLSVSWYVIGISNIMKHFGYIEDNEKKYYEEKTRQMNNMYNEAHIVNENQNKNEIDETTPIIVK